MNMAMKLLPTNHVQPQLWRRLCAWQGEALRILTKETIPQQWGFRPRAS